MKTRNYILLIIMFAACLILLSSCVNYDGLDLATGNHKDYTIKLKVNSDEDELDVKTTARGKCKATTHREGCIALEHGQTAAIAFKFTQTHGWYFSELIICEGGSKPDDFSCSLTSDQRDDFVALDGRGVLKVKPNESGVIDLTKFPAALKKFTLFDRNKLKQDYFYSVKACRIGSKTDCVMTDPPIENGGRF
jgi:hypothetical protein